LLSAFSLVPTGSEHHGDGGHAVFGPIWQDAARNAIWTVARSQPELTVDDVWTELEKVDVRTPDNSALGPLMREAAREGLIHRTNLWRPSTRPSTHKRPIVLWSSLIYEDDDE
jgi:hypothetical protein